MVDVSWSICHNPSCGGLCVHPHHGWSQDSFVGMCCFQVRRCRTSFQLSRKAIDLSVACHWKALVELEGFEPSTFPMESGRSLQAGAMVELEGFEPSTSSMPLKRSPN